MGSQLHDQESKDLIDDRNSRTRAGSEESVEIPDGLRSRSTGLDIIKEDQRKRHFHFDIPEGTRLTRLEGWPTIYLDPDL